MKYYEIIFNISPCSQVASDLLAAVAGEAGCESFEETAEGLKAYVQQSLFQQEVLDASIADFPLADTSINYSVREAEDKDWNEQWEQEGFEPIIIRGEKSEQTLVIHDGRHLPSELSSPFSTPNSPFSTLHSQLSILQSPFSIEIDAHLAFGTGTHETTRMICSELLQMPLTGKRVLDCGCGTGILGICALKLGAASCVGYDIDEWSSDNTRHNAVINQVDDRLQALCGDATLLDSIDSTFHLVMANINRNILLQDMPRFVQKMQRGSTLILSGFYQEDCALLQSKAQSLGLQFLHSRTDGPWACMVFTNY